MISKNVSKVMQLFVLMIKQQRLIDVMGRMEMITMDEEGMDYARRMAEQKLVNLQKEINAELDKLPFYLAVSCLYGMRTYCIGSNKEAAKEPTQCPLTIPPAHHEER